MSGRIVIVAYKPKKGMQAALDALTRKHYRILQEAGLVSDRTPIAMHAADGTVVEVFEWKSAEAIQQAHGHPAVLAMWEEYAAACDYVPVGQVAEAGNLFSEFTPFAI